MMLMVASEKNHSQVEISLCHRIKDKKNIIQMQNSNNSKIIQKIIVDFLAMLVMRTILLKFVVLNAEMQEQLDQRVNQELHLGFGVFFSLHLPVLDYFVFAQTLVEIKFTIVLDVVTFVEKNMRKFADIFNINSIFININFQSMIQHTDQQIFWLETQFQNCVETALQLSRSFAPQQTPYVHKYQAIQLLKTLLQTDHPYKFIPRCLLGQIYNDVQQNSDSVKSYEKALKDLKDLPTKQIPKFLNYLMIVYNMLGLSYMNREDTSLGIGCLAKAYEIYQGFLDCKGEDIYNNRCYPPKNRKFQCYYQGGVDHQQMQESFTLTLFYLAQAYTKLSFKQKAAQFCGRTLQRQHETGKFQINQFCHNLIGLSEYYKGNNFYSQAQYLLSLALKTLPQGKKKKMRAIIQIAIGSLLAHMLEFCTRKLASKEQLTAHDDEIISRQLLLFKDFTQPFPKLKLAKNLQDCKSIFRQANTQFKKALQVFVLDGYVTQNIEILFEQSHLYKQLTLVEKSIERIYSMTDKRRQILEPLLSQLNPKAYPGTWQKVLVEVSEIYNDLFNIKSSMIGADIKEGKMVSDAKLKQLNKVGEKSIQKYKDIITVLIEDKDAQRNQQFYRSIINSKFNIAKTTSRLLSNDKKERVGFLKSSFERYQDVLNYIEKQAKPKQAFQQEYQMTNDLIMMMPNRIDRINYGQISPLE